MNARTVAGASRLPARWLCLVVFPPVRPAWMALGGLPRGTVLAQAKALVPSPVMALTTEGAPVNVTHLPLTQGRDTLTSRSTRATAVGHMGGFENPRGDLGRGVESDESAATAAAENALARSTPNRAVPKASRPGPTRL